jgi:predicted dehydrogenase
MAEEMIRAGQFGQLVLVRLTYFSWFNPAKDDTKYWRVVPELSGGGPISDMGTHMFDVLIGLLGLPASIWAKTATLTHGYAVEDSCVATLSMADGALGIVSLNWNSRTWSHEFEIVGTEAKLKWHPYDGDTVVKTVGRDVQEIRLPNAPNVHYPLIEDFVSAVLGHREPVVTAQEAEKTNRLVDALYRSAREEREVALAEIVA